MLQVSSGDIDRGPFDIEVVITGDATEFQIPTGDALGDAVYQWRVIARDRALNTSSSVTRIFTVDTLAPGAPALVTPLDAPVRESFLDTRSPFLKWAPSTGDVFDYRLQVTSGDINTGPFDVDKEILDPTTGDLVVLNGDGTYQWRVIARDLALNTASSVVRLLRRGYRGPCCTRVGVAAPSSGRWGIHQHGIHLLKVGSFCIHWRRL